MNFRAHVVNGANKCLRILIQVRGKYKVCDFQVEIVACIDVKVLWFEVPMSEAFVLDRLQAINKLL